MNDLFTRSSIFKKVRLHEKRMVMKISNNQSDLGDTLTNILDTISSQGSQSHRKIRFMYAPLKSITDFDRLNFVEEVLFGYFYRHQNFCVCLQIDFAKKLSSVWYL